MEFILPDELMRAIPAFGLQLENPSLSRQEDILGSVTATKAGQGRFAGTLRFARTDFGEAGQRRQDLVDLFFNVLDDPGNFVTLPLHREFIRTFDTAMVSGVTVQSTAYNATDRAFHVGLTGTGISSTPLMPGWYVKTTYNRVPRIMQVVKQVGALYVFAPSLNLPVGTAVTQADSIGAIIRQSRSSTSGTITDRVVNREVDGRRYDFIERIRA